MKDNTAQLLAAREKVVQQTPDQSTVLPGSLLSRIVRCNKPGYRLCDETAGEGHGPNWILSVSLGNGQLGNLSAGPFVDSGSGLSRRLRSSAPGRHTLRASLGAGNLELRH